MDLNFSLLEAASRVEGAPFKISKEDVALINNDRRLQVSYGDFCLKNSTCIPLF